MAETIMTWVFGILTTLFGGLNIFQWITLRSYKRVKSAEADRMEIENLRLVILTMQEEIKRLNERYDDLQDEFDRYRLEHK